MKKTLAIIIILISCIILSCSVYKTEEFENIESKKVVCEDKVDEENENSSSTKKEQVKEPKKAKKSKKVKKLEYTEEELYVMSHVIMGEAESGSWEEKIGVGSVVLNRVKDERFPNTIKDVVFQEGQYACTWDGNYDKEPNQESVDVAKYVLEHGSQLPNYVIFQSQFAQGDSIYKQVGNTYFCYYGKDVN